MHNDLTTIAETRYLRLVRRGKWEFVTRKNITGIVGILAVTGDGKLVLVEQFRPPVNASVIEIPAGLAGDNAAAAGEQLADAALRELEEETGYRAAQLELLTSGAASAGLSDEIITLFRARGLTKVSEGGGDASESITVHEVPLDQVHDWLTNNARQGKVIDLKVYSALFFAHCR